MRVISCLVTQHNLWLVAVAALICALGSWSTVRLYWHARSRAGGSPVAWVFLGAVSAGATVWCTHFVAMLAYEPGAPVAYNPGLTGLSLIVAVVGAGFGLSLAAQPYRLAPALGGAVLGGGIATMHYTGMAAFAVDAIVQWNHLYVAASLVVAVGLGALALNLAANPHKKFGTPAAVGVFMLAIVGLHFTAMAAMSIVPLAPTPAELTSDDARQFLAFAVAGVGLLVVGTGVASNVVDRQTRDQAQARQRYLVEGSVDGMIVEFDGHIIEVNKNFEALTGLSRDELLGSAVADFLTDRPEVGTASIVSTVLRSSDGLAIPVEAVIHQDPSASGLVIYAIRDLRARLLQEQKITHLARTDSLTGLANRHWFQEEMAIALRRIGRDKQIGVLWIDLDRFKQVNDTLGHPIGDALLRAVGERLTQNVRIEDVVGRMGGDEFAIIQLGSEQPRGAANLAERLIGKLSEPFEIDGHRINIGASIGISVAPHDGKKPEELIKRADLALYSSKFEGRGIFRFFEQGMDEKAHRRRMLEIDLKNALALNQFELFYQPQLDTTTRTVKSFEALLRWRHPERGLVPPLDFIPVAEEIGLMDSIGAWVLMQACLDAVSWPDGIGVAVNVSATQFAKNTLEQVVVASLEATGLLACRLELEVTESTLLDNTEIVLETMARLRERGIKIAMDDFGTGYSSLSYLSRFPLDKIKIDRSFIKDTSFDRSSLAIIRAVIGLSDSLGLTTTAEGVETPDQLALLQAEGCNQVQGYYFSKPIPASSIVALLSTLSEPIDRAA